MGLEHVIGRGIPQPQVLPPARSKEAVVPWVERHPGGGGTAVLGGFVYLPCVLVGMSTRCSGYVNNLNTSFRFQFW